jgi:hypothetical protein
MTLFNDASSFLTSSCVPIYIGINCVQRSAGRRERCCFLFYRHPAWSVAECRIFSIQGKMLLPSYLRRSMTLFNDASPFHYPFIFSMICCSKRLCSFCVSASSR